MIEKIKEKERAILLRRKGLTYSEIFKRIPVAKSTLSLWLRSVSLSEKKKQRITEKRILAQKRGAEARRNIRLRQTKDIFENTRDDIKNIITDPLWLTGIALYWAEGAKQKDNNVSSSMRFSNMDSRMARLFLLWSERCLGLEKRDFYYDLYIHEGSDIKKAVRYWAKQLYCDESDIRVYLKRSNSRTVRKNVGERYHGVIRINIRKSSALNRKVDSWITHLCKHWGIV
ncbi:MAG: hypothetical protein UW92_C0002G0035 [Candidatus Jorgensenbacteria bacterium GW2011_GWA2_45_13]|uniref:Resolvase helix-turn-helix domain protein n=1 Tax=Candidatus Jorgensenbacteria bacterium GW2011_GWA2_45_13 TaxID=1618662 RepID=A0A0G1L8U7_9BACT|nr:MAG: hypothetical protein UW92_C0002G0035 [Candidatus Jorgensenbacteria bacterium GW2011_GWA2_45_13]